MSFGSFVKEPLLHFTILGALVFAMDHYVREDENNPRIVTVDHSVRTELTKIFEDNRGRQPKPAEYEALVKGWVYEEIMFREAKLLGLDRGDKVFRSRLETKLRTMIVNAVEARDPTDADLKTWLVDNKSKYNKPALYGFTQYSVKGEGAKDRAFRIAERLNNGLTQPEQSEDLESKPRSYKDRSREMIAKVFGEDFAKTLAQAAKDKWQPAQSKNSWHLVRLEKKTEAVEAHFEEIKERLKRDWTEGENKRLAKEAFYDILSNYDIRREDAE